MAAHDIGKLRITIREIVAKILRYQDRRLNEQNTKASLIEPILRALGWDVNDVDEVDREFKPTSKDSPVDYALALFREMKLFVEAKGLGENLSDRKWIGQILGYATVAGVEWCVLTDGDEYRFYNATAAVDADEKLFFKFKLSEGKEDEAANILGLISRDNLGENILDALWTSHFVDRRVKECLRRMLDTRDKGLLRLIRKRTPKLLPKEIAQSLRRLEIRIDSPSALFEPTAKSKTIAAPTVKKQKQLAAGKKAAETRKQTASVTLESLIRASLLAPPLRLFRKYKGHQLEATLLPNGKIEFRGSTYDTCSTAAEYARGAVTGRKMNTNGWVFWQYLDKDGKKQILDAVRQKMIGKAIKQI